MKMTAAITISCILAGLTLAVAGIFYSVNQHGIAFQYAVAGVFFSCAVIFLAVLQAASKNNPPKNLLPPSIENEQSSKQHRVREGEQFAFGVFWSRALIPFCPVCDTPLTLSTELLIHRIGQPVTPELHCFKCNKLRLLYDDDGREITLSEAKKLLSGNTSEKAIDSPKAKPLPAAKKSPPTPHDDYQPDETERRILAYLFKDGVDRDLGSIIRALKIASTEEARFHLEQLVKNHYIDPPVRFRPSVRPNYSLRQKGREFVIQNNLHREEVKPVTPDPQPSQLQTTISSVQSAAYEPEEADIEILKEIAKGNGYESQIANVLKLNAVQVSISLSLLNQHDYIELHQLENRGPYYRLTPKGNDFLNEPDYKGIPHPGSHAIIDDWKRNILIVLAQPDIPPTEDGLSTVLRIHPVRLQVHLTELMQHDYIFDKGFGESGDRLFGLTTKAKMFLIDQNLID